MSDVSRETPPADTGELGAPPDWLRGVFPSFELIEAYAERLGTDGVVRGLIGPREAPRLWERHVANCALLTSVLPEQGSVCDIGSGAGLPGLVLAIARPGLQVTLVEPLLRRTTFLEEVVDELGLANVRVLRGRAESLHGAETFDVVTSRAVAPLDRLLDWSMPLVGADGAMIALKGSAASDEVTAAAGTLKAWGCGRPEVLELRPPVEDEGLSPTFALRVPWGSNGRVASRTGPRGAAGGSGANPRGKRSRQVPRKPKHL